MDLPVHYEQAAALRPHPVCGFRGFCYDSTTHLQEVTCPKCLEILTPDFMRSGGEAVCERCEKTLRQHPHMKFGTLELHRRCDGRWVKL